MLPVASAQPQAAAFPTSEVAHADEQGVASEAAAAQPDAPDAEARNRVRAALAQLPICFEPNVGQSDAQVAFLSRGGGYTLFLTPEEMVLALRRAAEPNDAGARQDKAGAEPEAAARRA